MTSPEQRWKLYTAAQSNFSGKEHLKHEYLNVKYPSPNFRRNFTGFICMRMAITNQSHQKVCITPALDFNSTKNLTYLKMRPYFS